MSIGNNAPLSAVSNAFLFNEEAYRNIYPYTGANVGNQIFIRAWGKWQFVWAVFALVPAIPCVMMLSGYENPFQAEYLLLFAPPATVVLSLVLGFTSTKQWKWMNWKHKAWRKIIDQDFDRLKSGEPLFFWSRRLHYARKLRKEHAIESYYSEEILNAPNEVMFHALIGDDGVYVGTSKTHAIFSYREDIIDTYESDRYFGIAPRSYRGNIIFDKQAYKDLDGKRVDPDCIKRFIKAKRKGKDVKLADFIGKV